MAQRATVSVSIISSLPLSSHLWQVMWDETVHLTEGNAKTTRWIANVTYQLGEVNPQFMHANPFGLYITEVSWTPMIAGGNAE